MFKVGEIVRVGFEYNSFKKAGNPDFVSIVGSFVVLVIKKQTLWDCELLFYDIQNIDTGEIHEGIGDVWLEKDKHWYRKQKLLKVKQICSRLEKK